MAEMRRHGNAGRVNGQSNGSTHEPEEERKKLRAPPRITSKRTQAPRKRTQCYATINGRLLSPERPTCYRNEPIFFRRFSARPINNLGQALD